MGTAPSSTATVVLLVGPGTDGLLRDLEAFVEDYQGVALRELRVGQALTDVVAMLREYRLTLPADLETMVASLGFPVLSIAFAHLRRFSTLPRLHGDPFDRMMIAQALAEGIPIATRDRIFTTYVTTTLSWDQTANLPGPR